MYTPVWTPEQVAAAVGEEDAEWACTLLSVTDKGTFDVTPPYPYNTVVTLPAATAGATTLTLTVRMDFLVETAPKSNSYYRSTALDTLNLPLLTNGAKQ